MMLISLLVLAMVAFMGINFRLPNRMPIAKHKTIGLSALAQGQVDAARMLIYGKRSIIRNCGINAKYHFSGYNIIIAVYNP